MQLNDKIMERTICMGKRKYRISKMSPIEVEAIVDIEYHKTYDGICVTAGSLPGSGF